MSLRRSTLLRRLNLFLPDFALAAVLGISIFSAGSSLAGTINVTTEIQKFLAVADGLAEIVTGFTAVLVAPLGISSAAKIFKRLVLGSV